MYSNLLCWTITPINYGAWAYIKGDEICLEMNPEDVFHPDLWMIPVGGCNEIKTISEITDCEHDYNSANLVW